MAIEIWNADPVHSSINFSVRHFMVAKVNGHFARWNATLSFDEEKPSSCQVEVEIDAASIETRDAQRDAHLKSADFLEVDRYPSLTLKSTGINRNDDGSWSLAGDLTIRGITRPVTMPVEYAGRVKDPWGGERLGFSARTAINRKEFGLTWNQVLEAGAIAVGEKVEIAIDLEAVKWRRCLSRQRRVEPPGSRWGSAPRSTVPSEAKQLAQVLGHGFLVVAADARQMRQRLAYARRGVAHEQGPPRQPQHLQVVHAITKGQAIGRCHPLPDEQALEGLALAHRCSGDFQAIGRRKGRVDARPETPPQVPLQAHQRPGRPQIEDLAAGRWPSSPRSTSRQTKSGSTRQRSIQWAAHRFDGIP
jgi:polyisoprenoid-binding protein YceI